MKSMLLSFFIISIIALTGCSDAGGNGIHDKLSVDGTLKKVKVIDRVDPSGDYHKYYVTFGKGDERITFTVNESLYHTFQKGLTANISYNFTAHGDYRIVKVEFPELENDK